MGPMHDMETETKNEDLEEDHIHPKNTLTIETKNTKTQQHLLPPPRWLGTELCAATHPVT